MPVPDAQRLALLEALYQHATACEADKESTRRELNRLVDEVAIPAGLSRRDVRDYIRAELYPNYYRRRRIEDRGHL